MANYPTPHIHAKPGDFGKTVLMPGDPLRSKFIAENFLENAVLVNNVRGIHSWEMYTVFGVENIMRIGSTGAMQENINLRDIVIGQGACTDSSWAGQYHLPGTFAPIADYHMLETCVETAKELELPYHVGNILSSDRFYGDDGDMTGGWIGNKAWQKMGVMAVEMEAAALYMNAARAGKHALAICTVSDHLLRNENCTAEERQNGFTNMMKLALETAVKLEK